MSAERQAPTEDGGQGVRLKVGGGEKPLKPGYFVSAYWAVDWEP